MPTPIPHEQWEPRYWEHLAKRIPPRIWLLGWPGWRRPVGMASDEVNRRTVWVGPLVVALWRCRCADCRHERAHLDAWLDQNDPT